MEEPRKIPPLDIKLPGPSTYPGWVTSIGTYLDLIPIGRAEDCRVWDIVMGIYVPPAPALTESTEDEALKARKAILA
jgi:hypothetical protein